MLYIGVDQRFVLCCSLQQALKLGATKSLHCVEPEVCVVLRRTRGVCCVDSCGEPSLCVMLKLRAN